MATFSSPAERHQADFLKKENGLTQKLLEIASKLSLDLHLFLLSLSRFHVGKFPSNCKYYATEHFFDYQFSYLIR